MNYFKETGRPLIGKFVKSSAGGTVIASPGAGKELVITSISTDEAVSIGFGVNGASTLFSAAIGTANFPQGLPWGEDRHLSVSSSPFITITYWINDLVA